MADIIWKDEVPYYYDATNLMVIGTQLFMNVMNPVHREDEGAQEV